LEEKDKDDIKKERIIRRLRKIKRTSKRKKNTHTLEGEGGAPKRR
jgi:hypothetical protein